jgi:predicted ATPase
MRRFIITGAPGAGKTAIIRQLELDGFSVVEEAATDERLDRAALIRRETT